MISMLPATMNGTRTPTTNSPFERAAAELLRSVMSGKANKAINCLKSPGGKIATIKHAAWYEDTATLSTTLEGSDGLSLYMHIDAFGVWSGLPPTCASRRSLLLSGRNTSARMLRTSMRTAIDRIDSLLKSRAAALTPDRGSAGTATSEVKRPVGKFSAEVVKLEQVHDDDVVLAVVSVTSGAALKKLAKQPGQFVVRIVEEGGTK